MVLMVAACSSVKVSYDYDKSADFAKYKTYAFSEDSKNMPVSELIRDRILKAVETELAAKGFSPSDNPDVLVDMHVLAERKTEATATSTGPGYYGYGRYGYGGGFTTTQISYNDYVEGTLFINLVDNSTQKIAWQGRGTRTVDENASPEKREANINNAVKQIFYQYPPKK
jgi:hypothetical protein